MKKSRIYHGWWVVLTCFLLTAFVMTPCINLAGLFVIPISEEMGITRTAATTIMTISMLASVSTSLVAGRILARKGIRKKMVIAAVALGIAMLGRAFAPALWMQYVLAIITGFSSCFLVSIPVSILLNNWFGPQVRGRATGIAMVGSSAGAVVLSPLVGLINSSYGWRASYLLFAGLALFVILPSLVFTVSLDPSEKGLEQLGRADVEGGNGASLSGYTHAQAIKMPVYWLALVTFTMYPLVTVGYIGIFSPYFTEIGFTALQAAGFLSIHSAVIMLSKFALGFINDKLGTLVSSTLAIALILGGLLLTVMAAPLPSLAFPSIVVMGMGLSLTTVMTPLITAHLFGSREFGSIVGIMHLGSALGSAIGPLVASMSYDRSGSYADAWSVSITLAVVMLITTVMIHKMKKPVQQ